VTPGGTAFFRSENPSFLDTFSSGADSVFCYGAVLFVFALYRVMCLQ